MTMLKKTAGGLLIGLALMVAAPAGAEAGSRCARRSYNSYDSYSSYNGYNGYDDGRYYDRAPYVSRYDSGSRYGYGYSYYSRPRYVVRTYRTYRAPYRAPYRYYRPRRGVHFDIHLGF
jgi:hypothetical protein